MCNSRTLEGLIEQWIREGTLEEGEEGFFELTMCVDNIIEQPEENFQTQTIKEAVEWEFFDQWDMSLAEYVRHEQLMFHLKTYNLEIVRRC